MLELSAAQALSALHHRWYRAMWIVEGRSAEVASGLNNTISRFGELVTTALMNTMTGMTEYSFWPVRLTMNSVHEFCLWLINAPSAKHSGEVLTSSQR
jgi:hypothetical protein